MSCGVNIPLSAVVEAIVNDYADVFVGEILKRLSLDNSTINNGTLSDVTIRGGITLDEIAKGSLCSALQDCIAAKIQEELGCERDNHVTKFYIDKEKDHLVIELKFGERYYIDRSEIEDWLKIAAGGIQSGVLIIQDTDPTQIIRVTNKDGSTVDIDVSALKDIKVERGEIVSGVFVERNGGYWLDFTRNAGTHVNVDMTDIINKIIQTVFDMVMRMGYRINTQAEDYTLVGDDFNGRTIVRADKDGDQTITIPKPASEDFVGKAIIVRKTNGDIGTFVALKVGDGVTISPADSTPLRRVGSSTTLVYTGEGNWDVFGELP